MEQFDKESETNKGFVNIVLILGIIVVTLFLLRQYSQKRADMLYGPRGDEVQYNPPGSNLTSNWKTYTNAKYGFEFKYPAEWIENNGRVIQSFVLRLDFYSPDYKDRADYLGTDFPQIVIEKGGHLVLNLDSLKGLLPYNFEKLKAELRQYESSEGVDKTKQILVDGVDAIYHVLENFIKENSSTDVHFLHHYDNTLQFQMIIISAASEKDHYLSDFNTILSTLKFTK